MRAVFARILDSRASVLIVLGICTALAVTRLFPTERLLIDFSLDALLSPDAESRERMLDFQAAFGDDEAIVAAVIVMPAAHTIYEPEVLATLDELGAWLASRPEIDPAGVVTPGDLALLGATVEPEALRHAAPQDLRAIGESLGSQRLYRGALLSADGRATMVIGRLARAAASSDQRAPLLAAWSARLDLARSLLPSGSEVYATGIPLVQATYGSLALRDIVLLVPLTVIVIAGLLTLAFRRAYAVLGPLCAVGLATTWTLGLIQATGTPFNIVNCVSGAVLLVVGVADGAHIVARHRDEVARFPADASGRREAILQTMIKMTPACFVTSATTAVGFASLVTAHLPVLRDFGVHLAIGVMLAYAAQLLVMPLVLASVSRPIRPNPATRTSRILTIVERLVFRHYKLIVAGALFIGAGAAVGMTTLKSDARALGELDAHHPVALGVAAVEQHLGGVLAHAVDVRGKVTTTTCRRASDCGAHQACALRDPVFRAVSALREPVMLLTGERRDALWDALDERLRPPNDDLMADDDTLQGVCTESAAEPEVVRALAEVEAWLVARDEPLVARVSSMSDALADLGLTSLADDGVVRERLALLEASVPRVIARWLTPDHTRTQLGITARDVGIEAWRALEPALTREVHDVFARRGLAERFDVAVTGASTLAEKAMTGVLADLAGSMTIDFITILLFMVALFRSVRLAVLAMIPNVLPLVLVLGMMGLCGIEIRASTVIVFSVALGIAVDDTIHFMHRYREELHEHPDIRDAISTTLRAVGHPVAWTTAILVVGFLVNALSDFKAIVDFGVLSAITLVVALFVDLWLTPALLLVTGSWASAPKALTNPHTRVTTRAE